MKTTWQAYQARLASMLGQQADSCSELGPGPPRGPGLVGADAAPAMVATNRWRRARACRA